MIIRKIELRAGRVVLIADQRAQPRLKFLPRRVPSLKLVCISIPLPIFLRISRLHGQTVLRSNNVQNEIVDLFFSFGHLIF